MSELPKFSYKVEKKGSWFHHCYRLGTLEIVRTRQNLYRTTGLHLLAVREVYATYFSERWVEIPWKIESSLETTETRVVLHLGVHSWLVYLQHAVGMRHMQDALFSNAKEFWEVVGARRSATHLAIIREVEDEARL